MKVKTRVSSSSSSRRTHGVVIPYPAQGHINPMLQLCLQLVPRGFCFTFVNIEHNHQRMLKQLQRLEQHRLHLHMVSIAGGSPPELHGFKATRQQGFQEAQKLQFPFDQLMDSLFQHDADSSADGDGDGFGPPAFVLSDVLLGWTAASVQKFRLPRVVFWAAAAATMSSLLYMSDLAAQDLKLDLSNDGIVSDIPGLPATHINFLPKLWDAQGSLTSSPAIQLVNSAIRGLGEATFLLLNTFRELEGPVIDALSKRAPTVELGPLMPRQYIADSTSAVGPASAPERPSLFEEDGSCVSWLENQAAATVLFISFGSISVRSEGQMLELAMALDAAPGCRFLWVRRPTVITDGSDSDGAVEAQTAAILMKLQERGQGMVVPWAPQLEVLSRPAVGAFMTHCGWNSVMESVAMGVPMLCWADTGERMSNQRFVVDIWRCGVDVDPLRRTLDNMQDYDTQNAVLSKQHLHNVITTFMQQQQLSPSGGGATPAAAAFARSRASRLKISSISAFQESSLRLDKFAESMKALVSS